MSPQAAECTDDCKSKQKKEQTEVAAPFTSNKHNFN